MKKFSEDKMIEDLYTLYHKTLNKEVHYKIAAVAVNAAKAIAAHRSIGLKARDQKSSKISKVK